MAANAGNPPYDAPGPQRWYFATAEERDAFLRVRLSRGKPDEHTMTRDEYMARYRKKAS